MQARCKMQDKSDSDAVLHGMKRQANNSLLHHAKDAQDQRAECPTEHGTTLLSPMFMVHGTLSDFDGCGAMPSGLSATTGRLDDRGCSTSTVRLRGFCGHFEHSFECSCIDD
jgi:hypothetical protein